jgi:hypothetical protein
VPEDELANELAIAQESVEDVLGDWRVDRRAEHPAGADHHGGQRYAPLLGQPGNRASACCLSRQMSRLKPLSMNPC